MAIHSVFFSILDHSAVRDLDDQAWQEWSRGSSSLQSLRPPDDFESRFQRGLKEKREREAQQAVERPVQNQYFRMERIEAIKLKDRLEIERAHGELNDKVVDAWSTGPLARPFARSLAPLTRSLAPHYLLCLRAPLRSLVRSLAHFTPELVRKVVFDYEMNACQFHAVLTHCAARGRGDVVFTSQTRRRKIRVPEKAVESGRESGRLQATPSPLLTPPLPSPPPLKEIAGGSGMVGKTASNKISGNELLDLPPLEMMEVRYGLTKILCLIWYQIT